jgi:hypothetical protein
MHIACHEQNQRKPVVELVDSEGARQFRPPPFRIFMFALALIVMIIALLAETCSHR